MGFFIFGLIFGLALPFHIKNFYTVYALKYFGTIFTILLTAFITYKFAIVKLINQRRYEQRIERYLKNGIDKVVIGFEHGMDIYRENFANALRMIKNFSQKQGCGIKISSEEYDRTVFKRYDHTCFHVSPFLKLLTLLGEDARVYHKVAQYFFADLDRATNFFELELCVGIDAFVQGKIQNKNLQDFSKDYFDIVNEQFSKIDKYYSFLAEMQLIAGIFENDSMTQKDLVEMKDNEDIKNSIKRMEDLFEELTKISKKDKNNSGNKFWGHNELSRV